jgi:hypothetical protein
MAKSISSWSAYPERRLEWSLVSSRAPFLRAPNMTPFESIAISLLGTVFSTFTLAGPIETLDSRF